LAESGKTYPRAILLGPWMLARNSPQPLFHSNLYVDLDQKLRCSSSMLSFAQSITLAVLIALMSGCATQETPEQRAQRIEPILAAAGFRAHPADSPVKLQKLQAMTPLKVRFTPKDGKMHYWFADPVYCTCLYTGGQDAYEHYQQLRLQQKTVEQEQETAEMNESAASEEMDFGAWGGPFLY